MIKVYDTLTRAMVPLTPRIAGHVNIYTCGVTPYDHSHLGHARPAVVWDAIRRHLRRRGYTVTFVQNFTDVDDKIIGRALEMGTSVSVLANQYIGEYHALMEKLAVMPPDYAPRVTDNMEAIVAYIGDLMGRQAAYSAKGSVYFRVAGDPEYGRLSGRKLADMVEGVRIEVEPDKESPADFALWKAAAADEPSWPSPWGPGRPGWHIECSAMSLRYLGEQVDLHGGGLDLVFPHHENERAQSRSRLGCEPTAIWTHSGLVTRDAVKMSKSLHNGVSLLDLLQAQPPEVIRTYLLSVHYRSPLEFDLGRVQEWGQGLERLTRLWEEVRLAPPAAELPETEDGRHLADFEERFLATLDNDFNTARAFAEVFDMVHAANRVIAAGGVLTGRALARRNLAIADEILGFLPRREPIGTADMAVLDLVRQRTEARLAKDFALADHLRDRLVAQGYEVLDGPEGTRIRHLGTDKQGEPNS